MNLHTIKDLTSLISLAESLLNFHGVVAIDLETESVNPYRDKIIGAGLCFSSSDAYYVPLNHKYDQPFNGAEAVSILKSPLEKVQLCAFNAAFDVEFLELTAKIFPRVPLDVALMAYVKATYPQISLKAVSEMEFPGVKPATYREFMLEKGLKPSKNSIGELPVGDVAEYCGRDALATFLLYERLYPQVKDHGIFKLEQETLPVVLQLRRNGVLVDQDFFKVEGESLRRELEDLGKIIQSQVSAIAGTLVEFNIGSSQQLAKVLYDILKLPCSDVTEKGNRRTDKEVLAKLKWKHPVVRNIISYKEISKLATTYYLKYLNYVEADGRIHASYNQFGVPTGRLSCSDPNLQNLPMKNSWVVEKDGGSHTVTSNMRKGFIVPEGWWFLEADYSQIEARIAAGVTKEPILLNAFAEGIDFHTKTASLVFECAVENVTPEQRRSSKTLNFALSYGMGKGKLHRVLLEKLDITRRESDRFHDKYLRSYPTMFHQAEMIAKEAERRGYVSTIFGRRIPVFGFQEGPAALQEAYRMAYNGVIQGSAADVLKRGLVRTHRMIKEKFSLDAVKMIMTTHDSMAFEVHKDVPLVEFIQNLLDVTSMQVAEFPKFYCEVELGRNLGNLEKVQKGESLSVFVGRVTGAIMPVEQQKGGETFVLELPEVSERMHSQIINFKTFLLSRPGENAIILKIGSTERIFPHRTSVTLADKERILLMMGGKFYRRIV
jgi:DNA polymerase-1